MYTLDNRRLWVFKKLEADGYITDIQVKTVSNDLLTPEKFTTKNGGDMWIQMMTQIMMKCFTPKITPFELTISRTTSKVYTYRCRVETQPHQDIALQFCLMLIVCILKKCIHYWSIMNISLIVYNNLIKQINIKLQILDKQVTQEISGTSTIHLEQIWQINT